MEAINKAQNAVDIDMAASNFPRFNEHDSMSPIFDNPSPFGGRPSPFMPQNDLFGMNNEQSIDIDELVKNIDAQIAKLEKEEEERKQQESLKKVEVPIDYPGVKLDDIPMSMPKPSFEPRERKLDIDNTSVVIDNNVVTDDQFFDDFFGDE